MEAPLRIATVGAGYFSQFHHDAWQRIDDVNLVAVCDREEEKARKSADNYQIPKVYRDVREMLAETRVDLVDIITPPATHLALIEEIARHRISMICQKPFSPDLATAKRAVQIAEDAGVVLIVHENYRFQPWYRETRRLMAEGALGEVYSVTFRMRTGDGQGPDAYLDRQPYFQKMERFLIHETGIHFIDTFRSLLGELKSVYADLRRLNPVIAGEDAGIVLFEFQNGARGLFDGNRLVAHVCENPRLTFGEMLLEGSDATLRLDGYGRLFLKPLGAYECEIKYEWEDRAFCADCVYLLQRHIADGLLSNRPITNTAKEYLRNLEIEEAIYKSNETGRPVFLST